MNGMNMNITQKSLENKSFTTNNNTRHKRHKPNVFNIISEDILNNNSRNIKPNNIHGTNKDSDKSGMFLSLNRIKYSSKNSTRRKGFKISIFKIKF